MTFEPFRTGPKTKRIVKRGFKSSRKINSGIKSRLNKKVLSAKHSAVKRHRPIGMSNFGTPARRKKNILKKNFSTEKFSRQRLYLNTPKTNKKDVSDNMSVMSGLSTKSAIKRRLTDPMDIRLRSTQRSADRKKKRLERELRRKAKEKKIE